MASPGKSNIELLRQALAGRSGAEEFYAVLDESIEWDTTRAPGGTTVHGRDAVRAYMPSWRHGWEYWSFDEEGFLEDGDRILTPALGDRIAAWTFRGGRVVRFEWYEDASEALEP